MFFKLAIIPFIIFSLEVNAQESISTLVVDDIVITGTKTEKNLKEGPVKTELLSGKKIKENHYKNVAEVVVDIPGVSLSTTDTKLGQSAMIQGLSREHVLILVDGSPLLQNSVAGFDLGQISTNGIKQIEVIKGGASALYGGQAMGGVINIITNKPVKSFQYELDLNLEEHAGDIKKNKGYNVAKGHFFGRHHSTSYKIQLAHNQSSSTELDATSITRDTPDLSKFNGNIWLEQEIGSDESVIVDFNHYQENNKTFRAKLLPDASFIPVENNGDIKGDRLKLAYSKQTEKMKWTGTISGEKVDDELVMEHNPVNQYNESLKTSKLRKLRSELQTDIAVNDSHLVTAGAVADKNYLDQTNLNATSPTTQVSTVDVDNKSSTQLDAYLQDDWMIRDYELVSGVRFTNDDNFGNNVSPKVNLSYSPMIFEHATSVFRASYGSGFRIPNLKERFYVLDHRSFAGYMVLGNVDLKPETSHSFQFGAEIASGKNFGITANAFFNNVDNIILTKEIPSGTSERRFQYQNVNQAKIKGIELGGNVSLFGDLSFSQSFTYTEARDVSSGLILVNRPFYLAQSSLRYELPDEKISMIYSFRYTGDSYANDENTEKFSKFSQSDFNINYGVLDNGGIYLGIKNIFDVKRSALEDVITQRFDQRPSIGRTFIVGLKIEG